MPAVTLDSNVVFGDSIPSTTVNINASVVDGSSTKLHPNPIIDIDLPVVVEPKLIEDINTPVVINPELSFQINNPSVITPNAVDSILPPFPLNHARVMYESVLPGSASFTDNGVNPSFPLIPNTAQRWTTSVNSLIRYTLPSNNNVDTICIGAHNLSTGNYTVTAYYRTTDGGTLIAFDSVTPVNNNAIMFHTSNAVSAKVIEVHISNGSGASFIGSVYAGIAMQMQRPFFGGHTPAVLARKADYFSSDTESGNFIGVEVRRRALESDASWKNITDDWYRIYFVEFLASAEVLPFYFAWNLLQYPNDVSYCKNITNITPVYSGTRDLMTVSIPLIGIA